MSRRRVPDHGPLSLWLTVVWLLLPATRLISQGTRSDYERANSLRQTTQDRLARDRVQPAWLPDNRHFWYRVRTGTNTHEFILVDAENGAREPAFDHAQLARSLSRVGVTNAAPERLPIEKLDFNLTERRIEFRAGPQTWRYDLQTSELTSLATKGADLSNLRPVELRASLRTGAETSLRFINRTAADIQLFWLDAEGARRPYGNLQPGAERSQHTFAGHVWLVAKADGEPIAVYEAEEDPGTVEISADSRLFSPPESEPRPPVATPGISPDGRWLVVIRESNLSLKNLQTNLETPLSRDGTPDNSYSLPNTFWSPDSTKLAALQTEKGGDRKVHYVESSPRDQLQPILRSYDYLKPGDKIPIARPRLFHVPEHQQIAVPDSLFPTPWSIDNVHWTPDSRRFTFLYNQRGHQTLRIVSVDAVSGGSKLIVDERSRTFIDYAGKQFLHHLDQTQELIWMSERDGWNHLYLYDAQTGEVKNQITKGEWVVRGVERVEENERRIWFRASGIRTNQDPYYIHFCHINFDGTGFTLLTEGDGTHSVAFSPDRRFLIDTWSRVDLPPVTELRRSADGSLVCPLEIADPTALLATGWRAPERFTAKGRDGVTDIYGVIYRPTTFDSSRKYPVIEDIYAGPHDSFVPKGFRPFHRGQALAELGFIVVQIDGMGTSNRSKRFHDVCWKNLGDSGFPDRILWMKGAAAKYPGMDLTRVGIYGGSAGGQSALRALLAYGDFYHAGVADCGCHDNRMDKIWWNELWMGWPVGPHYEEQSNVTQAHKLQGKLLLTVGEKDENVDPASTMQVVNALIKADKDFELLVIPGGGHGSGESPYGNRRRQDFFVRHLLGVEPRSAP